MNESCRSVHATKRPRWDRPPYPALGRSGNSRCTAAIRASRTGATFSSMLPVNAMGGVHSVRSRPAAAGGSPGAPGTQALPPAAAGPANAISSPSSAQRTTTPVSLEKSGAGRLFAYSTRPSEEDNCQKSITADKSSVCRSSSFARKIARRLSRPILCPEPWSASAGPHPPAVISTLRWCGREHSILCPPWRVLRHGRERPLRARSRRHPG
jgi:hypothetical protein